ncbi:MAG: 3-deoxy-D-manno-octulosonic acid transferase [Kiritimatiellae bacterium]|nr:3-deoxy-D-manno-octulosonic acid transferase [Kiritimatiellia bacterium]MDD5520343.1 3-deoxy-D-manno-octulosonic acid transferase [Kiritimatiellia bacterium]
MLWFIYNILFTVGFLLMLPRFLMRMWRRGGYRKHFLQRLAVYSPDILKRLEERRRVWVHAVSVGEVFVALKFVEEMRAIAPDMSFVLTTTTSTGYRIAENRLNLKDVLLYFPSDFPFVVKRVLKVINPQALILTESELWPNIIRYARSCGIPVAMINGRISTSSYRGYRLLRVFFKRILECINLFLVQSDTDKSMLVELGAAESKIKVMGTAKYDVAQFDPDGEEKAREVLRVIGMTATDLIITGGSTWPGEEAVLLDIYKRLKGLFGNLKLVLVPRHAERSTEVEGEIMRSGLSYIRRTDLGGPILKKPVSPDVLLVNTTGELKNFYACASIIFVGKSLTQHGGQNVIEPALYAKPIVVGPNMENFAAVVTDFLQAGAIIQVKDAGGLEETFRSLLSDSSMRQSFGRRAGSLVNDKRGVAGRSAELILKIIQPVE